MQLIRLQLAIQYPEKTIPFYLNELGMKLIQTIENKYHISYLLQFDYSKIILELIFSKNNTEINEYEENKMDNYWKYSLFVDDIEQVYKCLNNKNYPIGEAYQFGDIGYLSHTKDTENHKIEFM